MAHTRLASAKITLGIHAAHALMRGPIERFAADIATGSHFDIQKVVYKWYVREIPFNFLDIPSEKA
jgi:hypothetical protein